MSHPSVNCAHQLPSMGANKPLLEERCHAVTEWWLFYFLGDHTKKGRPMVAPTNNDYSVFFISKAPSVTKRATDGRPYEREVSRSDGEVAIEKIKKAPPQTAEPPAPLKGSLKGRRCAVLYE